MSNVIATVNKTYIVSLYKQAQYIKKRKDADAEIIL